MNKCAVIADKSKSLMLLSSHCWLYHCWSYAKSLLINQSHWRLYQIIVDCIIADHIISLLINQSHWCYIKSLLIKSHYKAIGHTHTKPSNCKLQSHQAITTYKVIKLQITKPSSCHLSIIHYTKPSSCKLSHQIIIYTIIKSSSCKLSSHQAIIYTLSSHQTITTLSIHITSILSVIAEYFFALSRSRKLFNTKLYS